MLERLELAQAVAARQPGADRAGQDFLAVADWRPLLAFSQGNPLTVTVLARQALRDHWTSREQIEAFVAGLRAGAAQINDDAEQGRDGSLAASLDYGFSGAFTEAERALLALLSLFQGFADVGVLCFMGDSEMIGEPVAAVAGLDRAAGIALLDRAAEVGLLTAYTGGYYAIHPAVPWHLRDMFERYYGPPGAVSAGQASDAWTKAISALSNHCHDLYEDGHTEVVDVLRAHEGNLLQARVLAREHGWLDLAMEAMQGLRVLYGHTGRASEWRRLVAELVPSLTDPATGGPLPGREGQWALLAFYHVLIAQQARDWPTAEQLQQAPSPGTASRPPTHSLSPPVRWTTTSASTSATSPRPSCSLATSDESSGSRAAPSPTLRRSDCSSGSAPAVMKPPPRSTSGTPTRMSRACVTSPRPNAGTSTASSCSKNTTRLAGHGPSASSAASPTTASTRPGTPG